MPVDAPRTPSGTRLELRYVTPELRERNGGAHVYGVYKVGDKRPSHIVVIKAEAHEAHEVVQAVSRMECKALAGSPIIVMPPGTELELWEVRDE